MSIATDDIIRADDYLHMWVLGEDLRQVGDKHGYYSVHSHQGLTFYYLMMKINANT